MEGGTLCLHPSFWIHKVSVYHILFSHKTVSLTTYDSADFGLGICLHTLALCSW